MYTQHNTVHNVPRCMSGIRYWAYKYRNIHLMFYAAFGPRVVCIVFVGCFMVLLFFLSVSFVGQVRV